MKLLRRKLTLEYIKRRYSEHSKGLFPTYLIGYLEDGTDCLLIEDRDDRFCVMRGYDVSSYWILDVEYIYQLRRLLKLYNLRKDKYVED